MMMMMMMTTGGGIATAIGTTLHAMCVYMVCGVATLTMSYH